METYKAPGSFEDYIDQIKSLIKENRKEFNEIGRSLRYIHFLEDEVEANFEYFRECYDNNETPEHVVINLRYNDEDLFRKINNITDDCILQEVYNRSLIRDVISNADTYDLEDEINDRWDKTTVTEYLSDEDFLYKLGLKGALDVYKNPKDIICELLGFYNSWGCTYEEAAEALKKFF